MVKCDLALHSVQYGYGLLRPSVAIAILPQKPKVILSCIHNQRSFPEFLVPAPLYVDIGLGGQRDWGGQEIQLVGCTMFGYGVDSRSSISILAVAVL